MRFSRVVWLVACCLFCWCSPAVSGCYDEQLEKEYTLRVGEQVCLKNRKWNCKPVCFYYAGMTSDKAFSLLVPRQQGGMNLFYPATKQGQVIILVNHFFEVIEITPSRGVFKYKGEAADTQKED